MTTSDHPGTPLAHSGAPVRAATDEAAAAAELKQLREDFPRYAIGVVTTWGRSRYIGQRRQPGPGPHIVVTDDLAELRGALRAGHEPPG